MNSNHMKNALIVIMLSCVTWATFAQIPHSLTFQVEKLSKPEYALTVRNYDEICQSLILKESSIPVNRFKKDTIDFPN